MLRILMLDDEFNRVDDVRMRTKGHATVVHATNVSDFIHAINAAKFDVIMLDHDLGHDALSGCGTDAAKYLADNRLLVGDDQTVIIHSSNPIGVANMMSRLKYADHLCVYVIHFAWVKISVANNGSLVFNL